MQSKEPILEAHVQYELNRLKRKNLKATLQEEITALWGWFEQVKLKDVVQLAPLLQLIKRNVVERPLADEITVFIKENVILIYELLQKDHTQVAEIMPRVIFDQVIEQIIGRQALRHEVTHQLVNSSVYSMLISNVLYHGLKGFVLTENALVKNIPGASSFVRFGQMALNAAAPKIEKNIDKQLITFINGNIQETIEESEAFLNKTLDANLIRKLGDEVWAANATTEMSTLTGYVDPPSLTAISELVEAFWLHYRSTPFFETIVKTILQRFFSKYGKKDVAACLTMMNITPDMILQEVYALAVPFVEKAHQSGYLEDRIRTRLDGFYSAYYAQAEVA